MLKNMKLKILGQPYDEVLMITDSRYKNYKANEDRIIFKDGLLFRKNFGETGSVKYYPIRICKQLVNEVLRSLHGEFGKHPGIYKTILAYKEKYYFPKLAQLFSEWVMSCEQGIRESRIVRSFTRPTLQNPIEHITAPEDAMQIDLVPELPPSDSREGCFREEIPLCEVRAPNKVLHTRQDTTHFLLLDGDTIQTDGKLLTLRCRPMDHKRRQLEHLKQRASQKDETTQKG